MYDRNGYEVDSAQYQQSLSSVQLPQVQKQKVQRNQIEFVDQGIVSTHSEDEKYELLDEYETPGYLALKMDAKEQYSHSDTGGAAMSELSAIRKQMRSMHEDNVLLRQQVTLLTTK